MKRLGKFSGRIYNMGERNIEECCTIITDEQAADNEFIERHHKMDDLECKLCTGPYKCPMSKEKEVI